jgi:hypothetical protein
MATKRATEMQLSKLRKSRPAPSYFERNDKDGDGKPVLQFDVIPWSPQEVNFEIHSGIVVQREQLPRWDEPQEAN